MLRRPDWPGGMLRPDWPKWRILKRDRLHAHEKIRKSQLPATRFFSGCRFIIRALFCKALVKSGLTVRKKINQTIKTLLYEAFSKAGYLHNSTRSHYEDYCALELCPSGSVVVAGWPKHELS